MVCVLFINLTANAFNFDTDSLRDYDGIELSAGTFVPVINTAEVSTLNCDEHSADILRLVALRVPKTIIAKQYGCSVGNLYNFLNWLEQCA